MCRLDDFFNSNAEVDEKLGLLSSIISTYLSECERLSVDADSTIMQWQDSLFDEILSSWTGLKEASGFCVVEILKDDPLDAVFKR